MNAAYVAHALWTALRIARFDKEAVKDFDQSFEGFFRSFFGIVLCAPLYVIYLAAARSIAEEVREISPEQIPPEGPVLYALETLGYLAQWIAFPLVMILVTRLLGAGHRYVPYIVAYNWTSSVALAFNTLPYVLYLAGVLPALAAIYLHSLVLLYVLVYHWLVAREGLQISGFNASGIVMIDVIVSYFLAYLVAELHPALAPAA